MRLPRRALMWMAAVVGTACAAVAAPPDDGGKPDVFGSISFAADSLSALPQWRGVLDKWHEREGSRAKGAAEAESLAETVWRTHIEGLVGAEPAVIAEDVNTFINKLLDDHVSDPAGAAADGFPWPTPRDVIDGKAEGSLATAIAKFATLRLAGLPNEDARIVVTRDILRDRRHFVVAVRLGDRTAILDSMGDVLRDEADISTYVPLYSFNETTRWIHFDPAETDAQGAATGPGTGGTAR